VQYGKKKPAVPWGTGPAVPAERVADLAPDLVEDYTAAAAALAGVSLAGARMPVYLVLDHSKSMRAHYQDDDAVQVLLGRSLALSACLDASRVMPVLLYHRKAEKPVTVALGHHEGIAKRLSDACPWGTTNYVQAMRSVADLHRLSESGNPGLVVFQSDGNPDNQAAAREAIQVASRLPLFWAFVGFGRDTDFLRSVDGITGRRTPNASFVDAIVPNDLTAEAMYEVIAQGLATWLTEAKEKHVI
jgi:hypothetical protein